jgi:hypothetical protein
VISVNTAKSLPNKRFNAVGSLYSHAFGGNPAKMLRWPPHWATRPSMGRNIDFQHRLSFSTNRLERNRLHLRVAAIPMGDFPRDEVHGLMMSH